jgi:nitroreductase
VLLYTPAMTTAAPLPTRAQTPEQVRAFFGAHRTVRHYQPFEMPAEHLDTMLYAAQRAPTDATAQLYSLIRLSGEVRSAVAELTGNAHIAAASESFVVCADAFRVHQFVLLGGAEPGHSPASDLHFALGDAVLAGQNMLTAAEMLGYQGCWIGGVMNAPGEISALLELPPGAVPFAALTIGLSAEDTPLRPRLPRELVVHDNRYRLPSREELAAAAELMNPIAARPGKPGNWIRLLSAYFGAGGSMEGREGPLRELLRRQKLEGER